MTRRKSRWIGASSHLAGATSTSIVRRTTSPVSAVALLCRAALLVVACLGGMNAPAQVAGEPYDVVIYGGSSAGVVAAVKAAQLGKSTVLISSTNHVGGMTASGLGTSDVGDASTIGGLAYLFYANVWRYYHPTAAASAFGVRFDFEPHAAEFVFDAMLQNTGATVVRGEQLDRAAGVVMDGTRIAQIRMKSGRTFTGRMFIDATYEGDLMAEAGVPYHVGRESRTAYNESLAGVYRDNDPLDEVDPYLIAGDAAAGVLPGVEATPLGPDGTGDGRVQQFNLRLCVSNRPDRIPFARPANYDRANYELLRRRLVRHAGWSLTNVVKVQPLPGGKADINATGSFSTDMAGRDSSLWPEATDEERATILRHYRDYTQGMFWFLVHDPGVPAKIRMQAAAWGLAADEFSDTEHWPWQLYVREARRMVGAYLMTQHDCDREVVVPDSIALGSYGLDSHKVTVFVDHTGKLNTEGFFWKSVNPYPISYRSIVPAAGTCENLLVPICVSATHVAFNSLRMEPVYMMLGQSAATAACLAIDADVPVQDLSYPALRNQLVADGQILNWSPRTTQAALQTRDEPEADEPSPAIGQRGALEP